MGAINWGWRRYAAALITAGLVTIVPTVVQSTAADASLNLMTYHGAGVVRNIQLVGVDWDGIYPYETQGVPRDGSGRTMSTFLSEIVNSPYIDALSQYSVPLYTIARGSFAGWRNLSPSSTYKNITNTEIGNELKAKVDNASTYPNPDLWKANDNTTYVVFINGYHYWVYSSDCGAHSAFTTKQGKVVKFIVVPYLTGRAGCDSGNRWADLTGIISHEVAETVTDPAGLGWYEGDTFHEVADVCPYGTSVTFDGYNWWWVSQWWSNLAGNCRAVSAK